MVRDQDYHAREDRWVVEEVWRSPPRFPAAEKGALAPKRPAPRASKRRRGRPRRSTAAASSTTGAGSPRRGQHADGEGPAAEAADRNRGARRATDGNARAVRQPGVDGSAPCSGPWRAGGRSGRPRGPPPRRSVPAPPAAPPGRRARRRRPAGPLIITSETSPSSSAASSPGRNGFRSAMPRCQAPLELGTRRATW